MSSTYITCNVTNDSTQLMTDTTTTRVQTGQQQFILKQQILMLTM